MIKKDDLIESLNITEDKVIFDVIEVSSLLERAYCFGFKDGFDFYKARSISHQLEVNQTIQDHFNFVYNEK